MKIRPWKIIPWRCQRFNFYLIPFFVRWGTPLCIQIWGRSQETAGSSLSNWDRLAFSLAGMRIVFCEQVLEVDGPKSGPQEGVPWFKVIKKNNHSKQVQGKSEPYSLGFRKKATSEVCKICVDINLKKEYNPLKLLLFPISWLFTLPC